MKNNRFYYMILAGLVVLICSVWGTYFHLTRSVTSVIPLKFLDCNIPYVATHIDGKVYYLKLHLGTKLPLTLNKEILAKLNKKPQGTLEWTNEKGESFSAPSYLIPSIKVGNVVFKNVITCTKEKKTEEGIVGTIGRPLLVQHSLFFDFPHSILVIGKRLSSLKKGGFFLGKLVKVPFTVNRGGIVVDVDTDTGRRKLALSIAMSHTFIRSSVAKNFISKQASESLSFISNARFVLGGEDFGNKELFLFDLTEKLHEVDGCVGMDFLKNHSIYYDFTNNVAYIDKEP